MKHALLSLVLGSVLATQSFAADSITPIPMVDDRGLPQASAYTYSPGDRIKFPLLQWGADMTAIYANGNDTLTQPGSLFAEAGLSLELVRKDKFRDQVKSYLAGETPFIRGTAGMLAAASEKLCQSDETCPQVIYNYSRSAGGDSFVAINMSSLNDLKPETRVCLQADGPHMYMMSAMLRTVGKTVKDITPVWFEDLGFGEERSRRKSAAHGLRDGDCDAAFLIYPDMVAVTEAGDGQVSGAKEIFSSQQLDRVIFDVVAVSPMFAEAHPEIVSALSNALLRSNEAVAKMFAENGEPSADTLASRSADYKALEAAGRDILLSAKGVEKWESVVMEMYAFDLQMQRWTGNVQFLTPPEEGTVGVIWLDTVTNDAAAAFRALGLVRDAGAVKLAAYGHDWEALKDGLTENFGVTAPRLNRERVAQVVQSLVTTGELNEIASVTVYFGVGETTFDPAKYRNDFIDVLNAMAPSSGPIVAVKGHVDTFNYLDAKYAKGANAQRVKDIAGTTAPNLSRERAVNLVAALKAFAEAEGYNVPFDGVVPVGVGISEPAAGMCYWVPGKFPCPEGTCSGTPNQLDPCPPKDIGNPEAWAAQGAQERRVHLVVTGVPAETGVYDTSGFGAFGANN